MKYFNLFQFYINYKNSQKSKKKMNIYQVMKNFIEKYKNQNKPQSNNGKIYFSIEKKSVERNIKMVFS